MTHRLTRRKVHPDLRARFFGKGRNQGEIVALADTFELDVSIREDRSMNRHPEPAMQAQGKPKGLLPLSHRNRPAGRVEGAWLESWRLS
jgi:hypothetical protein